ncbi:hypothetical protein TanjilG_05995 [Lupinus angustifolius]|uniref:Profilin n=1 Tax=Lupinus angustifolius TaxID=3871 RepID=A0A4P1RE16_LUPAN|nr:PREDICTED: profilin-like [Lupinus angustifolius]OIW09019.1 hypothetical protein TanjilG_05995 [Lupinus angustifolius]
MLFQICMDGHLSSNIDGNSLTAAAFIGHDGSAWGESSKFPKFKAEEIEAIMKGFDEPNILATNGLYLGGTKYNVIQGENGAVINAKQGRSGISVKKTNKAVVIGIFEEPMAPEECSKIVDKLGDYLIDQGF